MTTDASTIAFDPDALRAKYRAELSDRAAQNGFFGGGSIELFRILREWRSVGALAGLELRT